MTRRTRCQECGTLHGHAQRFNGRCLECAFNLGWFNAACYACRKMADGEGFFCPCDLHHPLCSRCQGRFSDCARIVTDYVA